MNKVENAVLARIEARNERRPGDRALGRHRRTEAPKTARVPKMSDIRQFFPMTLEETGIHPVYAKDNDSLTVSR